MYKPANRIPADKPQQPENHQNHKDGPQHADFLLSDFDVDSSLSPQACVSWLPHSSSFHENDRAVNTVVKVFLSLKNPIFIERSVCLRDFILRFAGRL
jgi:hypothetical protein